MKIKKWIPIVLILVIALSAYGRGHKMGNGPHEHMKQMLELTDDQQEKIEALHLELDKKIIPLKSEMGIKQAELEALMVEDNPGEKAVAGKIKEIGDLRTKMHTLKSAMVLDMRQLLTPEQRLKFDKGHMHMKHGMHGEGMKMKKMHGNCKGHCGDGCKRAELKKEIEVIEE